MRPLPDGLDRSAVRFRADARNLWRRNAVCLAGDPARSCERKRAAPSAPFPRSCMRICPITASLSEQAPTSGACSSRFRVVRVFCGIWIGPRIEFLVWFASHAGDLRIRLRIQGRALVLLPSRRWHLCAGRIPAGDLCAKLAVRSRLCGLHFSTSMQANINL